MVNDLRSSRLLGYFVHQVTTLVFNPGHQADAFESGIDSIPQIQLAGNGNAVDAAAVRELGIVIPGQGENPVFRITKKYVPLDR